MATFSGVLPLACDCRREGDVRPSVSGVRAGARVRQVRSASRASTSVRESFDTSRTRVRTACGQSPAICRRRGLGYSAGWHRSGCLGARPADVTRSMSRPRRGCVRSAPARCSALRGLGAARRDDGSVRQAHGLVLDRSQDPVGQPSRIAPRSTVVGRRADHAPPCARIGTDLIKERELAPAQLEENGIPRRESPRRRSARPSRLLPAGSTCR